jgi:hypothetical protein
VRAIAMARFPFFPLAFRFLAPSFALSFRAYLSFFSGHFQKCLTAKNEKTSGRRVGLSMMCYEI